MAKKPQMPSLKEIERLFEANRAEWAAAERRRKRKNHRMVGVVKRAKSLRAERLERQRLAQEAPPAPAPVVGGISRTRAPRQSLAPSAVVRLATGRTKIAPGSLRDKVIVCLRSRLKEGWTIEQLRDLLKFDPKPVVAKLRDAGWVEVLP